MCDFRGRSILVGLYKKKKNSDLPTLILKTMQSEIHIFFFLALAKELRSLLTKLRISAHFLAIETGRYNNTPKEHRFCKHCPTSVENESHFILYCSRFDNLWLTSDYKEIFLISRVDADLIKAKNKNWFVCCWPTNPPKLGPTQFFFIAVVTTTKISVLHLR